MSARERAVTETQRFIGTVNEVIIFPLIALLSAVAFLVFLYGCALYIINADNSSKREEGMRHITWGIVGLVVMVSAWAILRLAAGTFGLGTELDCANNPSSGRCTEVFEVN